MEGPKLGIKDSSLNGGKYNFMKNLLQKTHFLRTDENLVIDRSWSSERTWRAILYKS